MFEVILYLNGLDPAAAQVELYADGIAGGDPAAAADGARAPIARPIRRVTLIAQTCLPRAPQQTIRRA